MAPTQGEPVAAVTMVCSVDEHVAGVTYDITADLADSYILKGYATGSLSRDYNESERHDISVDNQVVEY